MFSLSLAVLIFWGSCQDAHVAIMYDIKTPMYAILKMFIQLGYVIYCNKKGLANTSKHFISFWRNTANSSPENHRICDRITSYQMKSVFSEFLPELSTLSVT